MSNEATAQEKVSTAAAQNSLGNKSPQQLSQDRKLPSPTETGIYNPLTGDGVRVRDDGCIEITAGSTMILLDGNSGQITLNGNQIVTNSSTLNLHTAAGGLHSGYRKLNPSWTQNKYDPKGLLDQCAMVATDPTVLATMILTMPPGSPVPVPVPLITLLKPSPLFMPALPIVTMANKMADILKEMADDG